jgi:L-threonylcarbamoyladenylate synthase
MKILKPTELEEAAKLLREGKVIAFPTETVYGLGVVYDNKDAYDTLVAVKRRPPDKPFTLMLADVEDVEKYADLNKVSRALMKEFMPGQFTLITKAKPGLPSWCVSSTGNIGIRIADYDLIRNLIRKTEKPLLVPSANKSGEKPGTTAYEVVETFGEELAAVVDGKTVTNVPSTIVLVEDKFTQILREGAIKIEDIKRVVSEEKEI